MHRHKGRTANAANFRDLFVAERRELSGSSGYPGTSTGRLALFRYQNLWDWGVILIETFAPSGRLGSGPF